MKNLIKRSSLWIFAILAPLLAMSCGETSLSAHTPAPERVAIPTPAPVPDLTRTEAQVRAVEDKVEDVEDAVREVGSQLESAKESAESIEKLSEEAYNNGLEAGSAAAAELRVFVTSLKEELSKSIKAREDAMLALTETKTELESSVQANIRLREQVRTMAEQNNDLFQRLKIANDEIAKGELVAKERDEAKEGLIKAEERLKSAQKYVMGVWICIIIVLAWAAIKILAITGKFTPQGKIARFLF